MSGVTPCKGSTLLRSPVWMMALAAAVAMAGLRPAAATTATTPTPTKGPGTATGTVKVARAATDLLDSADQTIGKIIGRFYDAGCRLDVFRSPLVGTLPHQTAGTAFKFYGLSMFPESNDIAFQKKRNLGLLAQATQTETCTHAVLLGLHETAQALLANLNLGDDVAAEVRREPELQTAFEGIARGAKGLAGTVLLLLQQENTRLPDSCNGGSDGGSETGSGTCRAGEGSRTNRDMELRGHAFLSALSETDGNGAESGGVDWAAPTILGLYLSTKIADDSSSAGASNHDDPGQVVLVKAAHTFLIKAIRQWARNFASYLDGGSNQHAPVQPHAHLISRDVQNLMFATALATTHFLAEQHQHTGKKLAEQPQGPQPVPVDDPLGHFNDLTMEIQNLVIQFDLWPLHVDAHKRGLSWEESGGSESKSLGDTSRMATFGVPLPAAKDWYQHTPEVNDDSAAEGNLWRASFVGQEGAGSDGSHDHHHHHHVGASKQAAAPCSKHHVPTAWSGTVVRMRAAELLGITEAEVSTLNDDLARDILRVHDAFGAQCSAPPADPNRDPNLPPLLTDLPQSSEGSDDNWGGPVTLNDLFFIWQKAGGWFEYMRRSPAVRWLEKDLLPRVTVEATTLFGTPSREENFARIARAGVPKHVAKEEGAMGTNIWASVHSSGSEHVEHDHQNCQVSAVYYVTVPEDSGCLVFHDPRYVDPRTSDDCMVKPEPGDVVFFPPWMLHQVQVTQVAGRRISVAWNDPGVWESTRWLANVSATPARLTEQLRRLSACTQYP